MYLYKYNFFKNKPIIPVILTEHGIQKALGCSLACISQILSKLENKGYVNRNLAKIKNKKRKQFAFFLTPEGIEYALELKKVVGELTFNIKGNNYTQKKMFEYNQVIEI